jgi:hypothetical protein
MLRIPGPTYRYTGERIHNEIVYIDDHCYDEASQSFPVKQLLVNNPGDHLLVFDHLGHDDVLAEYPHVIMPVYLAAEVEEFKRQKIQPNWSNKTHCFNFMINKPRLNRIRLLEYVEQHKLPNRLYALPWRHSDYASIPVTDYRIGEEVVMDQGVKNRHYPNALTYQQLLQRQVFEPTCVSLITEPCYLEREIMITEKTVMAMYAGTLPIWVGGWRLPDAMRDLGFDVFDDIVDHSYSTLADPVARLDQALIKNQRLLTDFDLVSELIAANQSRLQHNVDLVEQNVFLDLVKKQVQYRPQLREIAELWSLKV